MKSIFFIVFASFLLLFLPHIVLGQSPSSLEISSPAITSVSSADPIHFYSLFADHQQKIVTVGAWTYLLYTTSVGGTDGSAVAV
jgi:hypothetical protein